MTRKLVSIETLWYLWPGGSSPISETHMKQLVLKCLQSLPQRPCGYLHRICPEVTSIEFVCRWQAQEASGAAVGVSGFLVERNPTGHENRRILHSASNRPKTKGIPETIVCRILMSMCPSRVQPRRSREEPRWPWPRMDKILKPTSRSDAEAQGAEG